MRRTDCEGEALVSGIRRRDFVILLGGGTAAWPLAAAAQQPAVPVIGFLSNLSRERGDYRLVAFREGLRETEAIKRQRTPKPDHSTRHQLSGRVQANTQSAHQRVNPNQIEPLIDSAAFARAAS
jgi:hypothetical protein